ncbi:hypothetical protein EDC01DRAFT_630676 [Geopyxis carbonaria]|nr:hypothetical protein EDC01DRAFT_630676 [Geopyxis carbonaria]
MNTNKVHPTPEDKCGVHIDEWATACDPTPTLHAVGPTVRCTSPSAQFPVPSSRSKLLLSSNRHQGMFQFQLALGGKFNNFQPSELDGRAIPLRAERKFDTRKNAFPKPKRAFPKARVKENPDVLGSVNHLANMTTETTLVQGEKPAAIRPPAPRRRSIVGFMVPSENIPGLWTAGPYPGDRMICPLTLILTRRTQAGNLVISFTLACEYN